MKEVALPRRGFVSGSRQVEDVAFGGVAGSVATLDGASVAELGRRGLELLHQEDPVLCGFLDQEYRRQLRTLEMIAASSSADPSVLACQATVIGNITTEGYPGARYHAGCQVVDEIELLAIERAKTAFQARYANVQPHSGTSANEAVMFSLLQPGDTLLGLELNCGGHLTHGSKASISGRHFRAVGYGLDHRGRIDCDQVETLAREHRPKLIICGASAYPRVIDFARFRAIADRVGAYLLADISHIAGLVAAGEHPSPIDHAHFTTTSTYKQLYGPRGGLILMGRDHDAPAPDGSGTLAGLVQRAVFPLFQGTPNLSAIAAKARALGRVARPEFRDLARRIVADARHLAECLRQLGYRVLTGGTDNHLVLIDVLAGGLTGVIAERALEECSIVVNKNRIPGDRKSAQVTSGLRLGSNSLALRGMEVEAVGHCARLIHRVLDSLEVRGDREYRLPARVRREVAREVEDLCLRYPIPRYPGWRAAPAPRPAVVRPGPGGRAVEA